MDNLKYSVAEVRNLLTSTLVFVFVVIFCQLLWSRRKLYIASFRLPGPLAFPFFGNINAVSGLNSTAEEVFNNIISLRKKWGPIFRLWCGPKLVIVISSPEDSEIVYNNLECVNKDLYLMKGLRALLGDGLVTSDVSIWKGHRKLINPTFNQKILYSFFGTFTKQAKNLTKKLGVHLEKGQFDILPSVYQATVRMICETSLGGDEQSFHSVYEKMAKYLDEASKITYKRTSKPWLYPDFIFYSTSYGRKFKGLVKYLFSIPDEVIQIKRQQMKLEAETGIKSSKLEGQKLDTEDIKIREKKVFIDLLMECHENGIGFTDSELKDHILTMIVTGSDTVANATSSTCLLLGSHPEIQEKAYAEIEEIFGDSKRDITLEDIPKLKYLERVIKETLRLLPPVTIAIRGLSKDVKLSKEVVPAGTSLLLVFFLLHRDPKYWPDPLKFDPDRFLPEEVSKRHSYAYLPFGGGPRNCIGYRYAMLAIKVLMCTLLRTYKFKSNIDIATIRLGMELSLKTIEGHQLQIEPRNNNK